MFLFLVELDRFEDGQILPVLWMEVTSGEISKELRAMIYHSTFSANAIQISLRYGTLLLCIVLVTLIVVIIYFKSKPNGNQVEEVHVHVHVQKNDSTSEDNVTIVEKAIEDLTISNK